MWTDPKGVLHISDQAPPTGVTATEFSADRFSTESQNGTSAQESAEPPLPGSAAPIKASEASQANSSFKETGASATPRELRQRDENNLTLDEKKKLFNLRISEERARFYFERATDDESRSKWKSELERIQNAEKDILEIKGP